MAKMEEIDRLRNEVKEEARLKNEGVTTALKALKGRSIADLVQLKIHWESERKKHRQLDEPTMQRRKEAEYWIEAIEMKLKGGGSLDSTEPIGGKDTYNPENLSMDEAADFLKISKSKLYKMTSKKEIPFHKIPGGRGIGFKKEELVKFLSGGKQTTTQEVEDKAEEYVANRALTKKSKKR